MVQNNFISFHNRLISFKLVSGGEASGLIVDSLSKNEKLVPTWYSFISSVDLPKWKSAELENDIVTMKKYERVIDINRIVEAKHL